MSRMLKIAEYTQQEWAHEYAYRYKNQTIEKRTDLTFENMDRMSKDFERAQKARQKLLEPNIFNAQVNKYKKQLNLGSHISTYYLRPTTPNSRIFFQESNLQQPIHFEQIRVTTNLEESRAQLMKIPPLVVARLRLDQALIERPKSRKQHQRQANMRAIKVQIQSPEVDLAFQMTTMENSVSLQMEKDYSKTQSILKSMSQKLQPSLCEQYQQKDRQTQIFTSPERDYQDLLKEFDLE